MCCTKMLILLWTITILGLPITQLGGNLPIVTAETTDSKVGGNLPIVTAETTDSKVDGVPTMVTRETTYIVGTELVTERQEVSLCQKNCTRIVVVRKVCQSGSSAQCGAPVTIIETCSGHLCHPVSGRVIILTITAISHGIFLFALLMYILYRLKNDLAFWVMGDKDEDADQKDDNSCEEEEEIPFEIAPRKSAVSLSIPSMPLKSPVSLSIPSIQQNSHLVTDEETTHRKSTVSIPGNPMNSYPMMNDETYEKEIMERDIDTQTDGD
ncbi:uncharacterized protein LOC121373663 isoform X2 [Gigantopelta aegis]|uniref:uncharacterized protein LOC121373663 isoform X2 n=1 Tax=Gigantopelta aegis TaxID=1735272 RepID=UPI001B88B935|nr:uncharacterized protein LOC121373663 isoform X2 [Gigantopelta aegis]